MVNGRGRMRVSCEPVRLSQSRIVFSGDELLMLSLATALVTEQIETAATVIASSDVSAISAASSAVAEQRAKPLHFERSLHTPLAPASRR